MGFHLATLLGLALFSASPTMAQRGALKCGHVDGFIDAAVAPDRETASAIYALLLKRLDPAGKRRFVTVVGHAADGRSWSVYGAPRHSPAVSLRGGGGLAATIDKCTGAVTRIHYSK
jgi:hypothetical protein